MRVDIILGTADAIERESELYNQNHPPMSNDHPCNTPVCMAGWAKYVELGLIGYRRYLRTKRNVINSFADAFGITEQDAELLYFADGEGWQLEYRDTFQKADGHKAKAKIAASYLREIVKRGQVNW